MGIALQCGQCGKRYVVKDELAGKAVKCKVCGKTLQVSARPDRPAERALAAKPEFAPPPPPDLDLYGLADEPSPKRSPSAAAAASASSSGADDEAPLPPRAERLRPKTKSEKKAFEKRLKAKIKSEDRSSFAQPMLGVSFGTVLAIALFGLRIYNRIHRPFRPINSPTASAALNPRPARNVGPITPPVFPDRGPGMVLQPGVRLHEVRLGPDNPAPESPGHRGKLWLYLPEGEHAAGSLACVVIAGAGSNLITGMNLGDGDRPEHLPYVHAGMAVLAYELDGAMQDQANMNAIVSASEAFLAAQAGLVNGRNALDFLASQVPEVDSGRIYAVGHSSAATMALLLAEHEPRIKGCVAFAPVVDTAKRTPQVAQAELATVVPGADAFFTQYNPRLHEEAIRCPLFLFHAQDDSNVPVSESIECKARLEQLGKPVTLQLVPTGNHYDSMLQQGIPRAVAWLKGLGQGQ